MKILDHKLYHIPSQEGGCATWGPGTKIDTRSWKWNYFFSFYTQKKWQSQLDRIGQKAGSYGEHVPSTLAKQMYGVMKDQAILIRELVFEDVRLQQFPSLPSRKSCAFLFREEHAELWWKKLGGPTARRPIAEVVATGEAHFGDEQYLRADCIPYDEHCEKAVLYWKGTPEDRAEREEVVFFGEFEVVSIWQSLEHWKECRTGEAQQL